MKPVRARVPVVAALVVLALLAAVPAAHAADVELFSREGCPRCVEAEEYLRSLAEVTPGIVVEVVDVGRDPAARARLAELAMARGTGGLSVPSILVRGTLLVGWSEPDTPARIAALLDGATPAGDGDGESCSADPAVVCEASGVDLPLFGRLDVRDAGLPLFTVALGLVDGFNPCAMWVLLLLLALLVNVRSRAKMATVAGVFVAVSGVVYFAFMAAWLNAFLLFGVSRALQVVLGIVAIAVGTVHVKDFLVPGRGVSLSIPDRAKPGLYARMRAIVNADDLPSALAATVVMAVLVNAVELLCTAGLPAIYTQVLAAQGLSTAARYGWLALYVVAYVFDDAAMVAIAVVTLGRGKLQDRAGRWLKLASGGTILVLGVLLLARPQWLVWR